MRLRRLVAPLAAVLVTAAGVVGLGQAPAGAAACSGAGGATVIVDFAELGGVRAGCDTSVAGQVAQGVFADAGFPLTMAPGGFVCRVSGVPTSDNCADAAPADAYWSLWTADGKGGGWVYATRGVASLRVPEGGYVAFAWHQGGGRASAPSVTPTRRDQPTPAPTTQAPQPTKGPNSPTKGPGQATTAPSSPGQSGAPTTPPTSAAAPSTAPTPSASPTEAETTASTEPTANPSATASSGASAEAADVTAGPVDDLSGEAADEQDGGLPFWVPVLAVLAVLGAGGLLVARRRGA